VETLRQVLALGLPLLAVVGITGALSLLNGYLLSRWAKVDPATSTAGTLPGAASAMAAMAGELGADPVGVTILTYVRLIMVAVLTPLAVSAFLPGGAPALSAAATGAGVAAAPWPVDLVVLLACGILGVYLGKKLHLPSPSFLGPVLAIILAGWAVPYQFVLPGPLFQLGMLLVGLSIGMQFNLASVVRLGKAVLIEVFLVVALIAFCLVAGYGIHWLTGIDALTCALGTAPGAMEMMTATAVELGGDGGLVLAMQMTRLLIVLLFGPWITTRMGRREAAAHLSHS